MKHQIMILFIVLLQHQILLWIMIWFDLIYNTSIIESTAIPSYKKIINKTINEITNEAINDIINEITSEIMPSMKQIVKKLMKWLRKSLII